MLENPDAYITNVPVSTVAETVVPQKEESEEEDEDEDMGLSLFD